VAALPAATFAVGASRFAALFALYLVGLLLGVLRPTLRLRPGADAASLPARPAALLRWYTSALLVAAYAAQVGGLAAFGRLLQPEAARDALAVLGLWCPGGGDLLRLLSLLLLVSCRRRRVETRSTKRADILAQRRQPEFRT
jgi:hypothetical protein